MPDLPIGGLPPITTPVGTDEIADEQAGTTFKITLQEISDFASAGFNPGLVEGQVVYGGASGELKQSSNFTFDEATQSIHAGMGPLITGTQSAGFATFGGTISGDNSLILGGTLQVVEGNRSAIITGNQCRIESDESFVAGRAARIFAGADNSYAFGQSIDVMGTASGSFTFSDKSVGFFNITELNSWNVRASGNSQFETTATGTYKMGSVAAGDYIQLSETGIDFFGGSRFKNGIAIDPASVTGGGITPPNDIVLFGNKQALSFLNNAENEVFISGGTSDNIDPTTNIEIQIFWSPNNTNTGNVEWRLDLTETTPGNSIDNAITTFDLDSPASGVIDDLILSPILSIPASNFTPGNLVNIRLYRPSTDPYTGVARFLLMTINGTRNKIGGNL